MSVLTPLQRAFLAKFFARSTARAFYLTGGGALAEFYLNHRLSQDLDLFTQEKDAWASVEYDLKAGQSKLGRRLSSNQPKKTMSFTGLF